MSNKMPRALIVSAMVFCLTAGAFAAGALSGFVIGRSSTGAALVVSVEAALVRLDRVAPQPAVGTRAAVPEHSVTCG